ncbi:MAG: ABC transporter substrate-binding protein [Desulfovibrionaceae bacterium]|nr:ABC transporter substrate-binding protein [Desulfovibrionaceae bacterium]
MMLHRHLRALCVLGFFALICIAPAAAAQDDAGVQARRGLEMRVNSIFTILQNPGFTNKASRPQYRMKIEEEVARIFDFTEFSSRTVGPRWNAFTPEQRRNFTDAFESLLKATYLDRIDGYNGEKVAYLGEQVSAKGDRVEVRTTLNMKGNKVVPVNYRMLPKDGAWVVYDVIIENISLVMNYRTQFQELLLKGSPEALIARILEQANKTRESVDAH